jgi:hypothetical protein
MYEPVMADGCCSLFPNWKVHGYLYTCNSELHVVMLSFCNRSTSSISDQFTHSYATCIILNVAFAVAFIRSVQLSDDMHCRTRAF